MIRPAVGLSVCGTRGENFVAQKMGYTKSDRMRQDRERDKERGRKRELVAEARNQRHMQHRRPKLKLGNKNLSPSQ